jgi:hypothetical protein
MHRAGATWEPGSKRWLIDARRIWPVVRAPLRAGVDLEK